MYESINESPTPGDWHHKDGTVFSSDGHIICSLIQGRYHADDSVRIAEREANGRLLASSPRILKTLSACLVDYLSGKEFKHDVVLEVLREADPARAVEFERLLSERRSA